MPSRTLVAIPALNEAATIASVIAQVQALAPDVVVLVIDDGSKDETARVAIEAGAIVVAMPYNLGVGGAMRTAFLYAQRNEFHQVIQIDADGQHDPAYIASILDALQTSSVVVGARFADEGTYAVHGPRKWAMRILARTLSKVAGTRLTDATSGFRGADRAAIALFAEYYPAEYLGDTVESLVIASRAGLRITQVPVEMRPRQGGQPSQSPLKASLYLGRAILALVSALTRRYDLKNRVIEP